METGKSLGGIENELEEDERVVSITTPIYTNRCLSSNVYKEELTRGLTVNYNATHTDFTHVSYIEYDGDPDPTRIRCKDFGMGVERKPKCAEIQAFFPANHTGRNGGGMGGKGR